MPASQPSPFALRALRIAALRTGADASAQAAYAQFRIDHAALDGQRLSLYSREVMPANGASDIEQDVDRPDTQDASPMYFEVYRAERVSLTSILFSGEDWRWRFCTPDGEMVAGSEGYPSEEACRRAVALLQREAGGAECHDGTRPVRSPRRSR